MTDTVTSQILTFPPESPCIIIGPFYTIPILYQWKVAHALDWQQLLCVSNTRVFTWCSGQTCLQRRVEMTQWA
jgi:hypothetical protein